MSTGAEFQEAYQRGVEQFHAPEVVKDGGVPYAVVPDGLTIENMEYYLPAPVRKKASVAVFDVDTLAAYLKDQDEKRTRIFASVGRLTIQGVLDYHDDSPRWGDHEAVLTCSLSDDWRAWTGNNNKSIGQTAFAEFLEDHAHNVVEPESAAVLQMVTNLEANKSVQFKSGMSLQDGSVQLEYVESISDNTKGKIKIPKELVLGIHPFKFGKPWQVVARLRYRINEGKLTFTYILNQPDKVLEEAFRQVVTEAETKTGIKPYLTA